MFHPPGRGQVGFVCGANLGKIHPPFFIDATSLFLGAFPLLQKECEKIYIAKKLHPLNTQSATALPRVKIPGSPPNLVGGCVSPCPAVLPSLCSQS